MTGIKAARAKLRATFNAGPDFLSDPRRGCAPDKISSPDVFFNDNNTAIAIGACNSCPFRQRCDAWATENHEQWGVWGGRARGRVSHRQKKTTKK